MKIARILIAVATTTALGSVAGADGYEPGPQPVAISPTTVDWTGFYIGGQGGYQWSDIDLNFEEELFALGNGTSIDSDGWMGGVHVGAQKQFGQWVAGVELSGDWGESDGSAKGDFVFDDFFGCLAPRPGLCGGAFAFGDEMVSTSIDKLFMATGRFGYAWDKVLVFAKGGYASAEVTTNANFAGTAGACIFCNPDFSGGLGAAIDWNASGSTEERHHGWTLGTGVDIMAFHNVSFGIGYDYIHLQSKTHRGNLSQDVAVGILGEEIGDVSLSNKYGINVDPGDIHKVSARLTFHFNAREKPVVPLK